MLNFSVNNKVARSDSKTTVESRRAVIIIFKIHIVVKSKKIPQKVIVVLSAKS
jgi:hypothetical protein